MTSEELALEMAAQLARDILKRPEAASVHHFSLDGRAVVVSLTIQTAVPEDGKALYVSLGPAGKQCSRCGGSGKEPQQAKP